MMPTTPAPATDVPLCVDMDGTLIRTDSLVEATAHFLKTRFYLAPMIFVWLTRGKAHLKDKIAAHAELDVTHLPYEDKVVEAIRTARDEGRTTVLCTASNQRHAQAVADHLGLFDEVMSSDGTTNLSGDNKQQALVARFGEGGYDYVGNDVQDVPAFESARKSIIVAPTRPLRRVMGRLARAEHLVPPREPTLRDYADQLRLHQWLKNMLLFVPLLASQKFGDSSAIAASSIAFLAYGLCASSVYVLNDLMDLPADRRHPRKCLRPFASARIPVERGILLIPALLIASFALASLLPLEFVLLLAGYYFVTLNYNLWAKNVAVLDTLVLAGLYTLRVIAGAAAISVVPSFWLLAFSMFFFLSVAMAKRYAELVNTDLEDEQTVPGRQYRSTDLSTIMSEGAASGNAAVLVLALYINSDEVRTNYSNPDVIWLTCPLLLYWVNKLWLNTQRREMHDDPLVWALENRVSRAIAVLCALLLFFAI